MDKPCEKYSFEDINRYVDNELPQKTHNEIAGHYETCAPCRKLVADIRAIGSVFNRHIEQQVMGFDSDTLSDRVKEKLATGEKTVPGNIFGNTLGLFGKNIYLKLSGITAILIIGLAMLNGTVLTSLDLGSSGPSAIVSYVDTELPSVMIIETQKRKHTIIWFSEI
ncbi:MAG: zf-HC2 domain-containing protein [Desulfobacula sp.]|nr:zf-HC2 domain-containing protein [Desulfobacula sp.]